MHCLIWIKFCEARGIYPIAHAVGLWSVFLCISFTTTENVRVWRIVQDGMNRSHCKESKPSKNSSQSCDIERSTLFADLSVYVEVMDDSKLSDATAIL